MRDRQEIGDFFGPRWRGEKAGKLPTLYSLILAKTTRKMQSHNNIQEQSAGTAFDGSDEDETSSVRTGATTVRVSNVHRVTVSLRIRALFQR